MNKLLVTALALSISVYGNAAKKPAAQLQFDASKGVAGSVTMPSGKVVNYTAYTGLYYVTNVEDSTYQYLNFYVPQGATQSTPIFFKNDIGGYMASAPAAIDGGGVTGRALAEGYVVASPGARGRGSTTTDKKGRVTYNGRAPKGLLDLKAAVRYLREFDAVMPGDAERIISDGTSAGGAMSSLLGATGNHPDYEPLLKAMGAASQRDDIFATVAYCPITDLEHADMAYEWLYGAATNGVTRPITDEQQAVSEKLAALYPEYLNSLQLKTPDGTLLTADNYCDYLKTLIIESAQLAKDAGADIPDTIGFKFSESARFQAPINGGVGNKTNRPAMQGRPEGAPQGNGPAGGRMPQMAKKQGETITDLDLDAYLNYVVTTQPLKTAPAFDSQGVAGGKASGENEEFGDTKGNNANFTDFSLQQATGNASATVSAEIKQNVRLLNPMNYIDDSQATTSKYWYIRHGARDRDTSFNVPVNLALKLQNAGYDVNFRLPWNRPHSGDYALNEMFAWMQSIAPSK